MSIQHLLFSAALLLTVTASPLAGPAHAFSSAADKELFCEARRMVIPYDEFSNSLIVSVRDHVVTLSGYIDSDSAKRHLGESLASLKGVKKVRNSVMVRTR